MWLTSGSTSGSKKNFVPILLLSVYSPLSDWVGLPLHNIPSPFLSVMDIFFVDQIKFFLNNLSKDKLLQYTRDASKGLLKKKNT